MRLGQWVAGFGLLLGMAQGAWALQVTSLSPQGEVAQVRQVVARFDGPAVDFGDAKAASPLTVTCSDALAAQGNGRWISDREWAFQFADDLPAGLRCTVQAAVGFTSSKGERLSGTTRWTFNTGGPFVRRIWPSAGSAVDEQQVFVLQLSGAATPQSLAEHVHCRIAGLGEQVATQEITGEPRDALLKSLGLNTVAARQPQQIVTLRCARRLPAAGEMTLVYGAGVRTPSGVANSVDKRFAYVVREPFAASFSCERENAQSGCVPLRPLHLRFNAPVSRKLALAVRLQTGGRSVAPVLSDEDGGSDEAQVDGIRFDPPFAENATLQIVLPPHWADADGRAMRNADAFPMKVVTGAMPPLAKFATSPFGIVERFAEGVGRGPALLPVTLRRVELAQGVRDYAVADLQPQTDAQTIAWFHRVQRFNNFFVSREVARKVVNGPLPPVLHEANGDAVNPDSVQTRMVSLLDGRPGVRNIRLPAVEPGKTRPFEVVGIPLQPGFHVVEIASKTLGQALLDPRYGAGRTMVVRTAALVTNLNVSVKIGRENALAWVTSLDKGRPVAGARVQVSDCHGTLLTSATTDAQGLAQLRGLEPQAPYCDDDGGESLGYFVSARATDADGTPDMAFAWSRWNEGFQPWRFNVPTSTDPTPDIVAHTVFDRTLLRAGETVSMKHVLRVETMTGLALPKIYPDTLVITHVGSGQTFRQPLQWRRTPTGGMTASSRFAIPKAAKLGTYSVQLQGEKGEGWTPDSGSFRVEEFRLPVFTGRIVAAEGKPLIRPSNLPVSVQVSYTAGGPAANLPVQVSALVRNKALDFDGFEAFSFSPPRQAQSGGAGAASQDADDSDASSPQDDAKLIADKLAVTLDKQGQGRVGIEPVPASKQARDLLLEASYADPNGEIQTLRHTQTLWPAAVVAGIKTESWVSAGRRVKLQALALNLQGRPQAGVSLAVQAIARITTTSRKRMVGGFYAYDNKTTVKDLGTVCSGKSDAHGLLPCEASMEQAGEIELIATATDAQGRSAQAASSVWVTRQGELWFGGENHDRMDVLPEKKTYQPGETAQFQVRMPFRRATALVAVEREGVMHTEVVQLDGRDPTVRLTVQKDWGPNVYVSVLALRGRLYDVPWYSLFTWGYKTPLEWWRMFWGDSKDYVPPTAMVDLSKPAFRFGMAEIRVGTAAHALKVTVQPDRPSYPVRGTARVTIRATLPDGKPAAGADVALAAVDQALLELMPNTSWDLLQAMYRRRDWGVVTATAQSEVIGRRHYGLKAVPAGGGGGKTETRELFDTLLLWKPDLVLDAQGMAVVDVPLNDSLTAFRLVAVAERGLAQFGTGQATIRSTQDLQILSGLPPLVREGDTFTAPFTLRNTTRQAMRVTLTPQVAGLALQPQTVEIAADTARDLTWSVTVPQSNTPDGTQTLAWQIDAHDSLHGARDALRVQQQVLAAVPLAVQQASLQQLDGSVSLQVAPPPEALTTTQGTPRGGLKLALQPTLVAGLDGVRDWFRHYPYGCLEQKASIAIGLMDVARWQALMAALPTYLDADGLANYFPVREGDGNRGSDVLTAYLLTASDEASRLDPAFAIPDDLKAQMQAGLVAFVAGRLERKFWAPHADLDVRKLAAIEALARGGKAQPRMLQSITLVPNQWPTSAVIDWMSILQRLPEVPQRAQHLAQAESILRARLSWQGTKLVFSTERDDAWWWLMTGGDVNTARLMLLVMSNPAWRDELPRLASGFIARQQRGAWATTTANLWGSLAIQRFARVFESETVSGLTRAVLGKETGVVDWGKIAPVKASSASGALHAASPLGAPGAAANWTANTLFLPWPSATAQTLQMQQQGSGKPWVTVQSWAAVPLKTAFDAGYGIRKTLTPVEQAVPGKWSRGDVVRVTLDVNASSDMSWVVVSDPIPGGASILGGGLGRDSAIATRGEQATGYGWDAYEERSFSAFRSYYAYLPKGKVTLQYTLRLNAVGSFALPPTRVEAMYAPEMFGEAPNARFSVEARP